jgi:hypothetical protein
MATSVVMIPVTDGIPVHIIYQLVQRQLSRIRRTGLQLVLLGSMSFLCRPLAD